jgi:hypothetical protein
MSMNKKMFHKNLIDKLEIKGISTKIQSVPVGREKTLIPRKQRRGIDLKLHQNEKDYKFRMPLNPNNRMSLGLQCIYSIQ